MQHERGFSVVETLIAAAIFLIAALAGVTLLRQVATAATAFTQHHRARAEISGLTERWQAEAKSAFAIFVPAFDVLGQANADGHEFDFFTRTANGKKFWAYRWDGSSVVQRYEYGDRSPDGALGVAAPQNIYGVTGFRTTSVAASSLSEPFLTRPPKDVNVKLGYHDVTGGNRLTRVSLAAASTLASVDLLAGIAPSGFTVIAYYTPAPSAAPAAPPSAKTLQFRIVGTVVGHACVYPSGDAGSGAACSFQPIVQNDYQYSGNGSTWVTYCTALNDPSNPDASAAATLACQDQTAVLRAQGLP